VDVKAFAFTIAFTIAFPIAFPIGSASAAASGVALRAPSRIGGHSDISGWRRGARGGWRPPGKAPL
jgi:hypothetical protein